jgi:type I restriction enzyme S subunit
VTISKDYPVPLGWAITDLQTVSQVNPTLDKSKYPDTLPVSFVPMPAVEAENGSMNVTAIRQFGEVKKGFTPFLEGDVLFAKITPCMENGKMAVVPPVKNGVGFGSTEFHVLRPYAGINARYIYYFISSQTFRRNAERKMTGAVGQRRVPTSYLAEHSIPLAPSPEQTRIVEKLEEMLSELDKAVERFSTAEQQLKSYRHALLNQAFQGRLTTIWRKGKSVETPTALLARVEEQRSVRYEQQVKAWRIAAERWEAEGSASRKPAKPDQLIEFAQPTPEELNKLPPLPDGYAYTYLANLGDLGRGKSKHRPRNAPELLGGPYPFIQTGDVRAAGRVIRDYSHTYSEIGLAQSKLWPKGTLCITIAANIAETAFLGFDGCFPDSVVGFTAIDSLVLPQYVELFIKSVRPRIAAYAPATAQKNINLSTLENLVVPLCSLHEQREIVNRLEAILSVLDEQESAIHANVARTAALRESILNRAFAGRLVRQDPDDEAATELVERLRARNNTHSDQPKRAKKRNRAA